MNFSINCCINLNTTERTSDRVNKVDSDEVSPPERCAMLDKKTETQVETEKMTGTELLGYMRPPITILSTLRGLNGTAPPNTPETSVESVRV